MRSISPSLHHWEMWPSAVLRGMPREAEMSMKPLRVKESGSLSRKNWRRTDF